MNETVVWLALSQIEGLGKKTLEGLLEYIGSPEEILAAPVDALAEVPRVSESMAREIASLELSEARARLEHLRGYGIEVSYWRQPEFPRNLFLAPDCPAILYTRGQILPADELAVAIVGSTYPAGQNLALARRLAGRLAGCGLCVVSGLARGIDSVAHRGAIEAGGRTLAVLGSGVDRVFPPENRGLAEEVEQQGAILSELPPGTSVSGRRLMARNRITSGLARAVIVVESRADSGSVQTAEFARRQGRLVLAVSGGDRGNERLICGGAAPIRGISEAEAIAETIQQFRIGTVSESKQQMKLEFE